MALPDKKIIEFLPTHRIFLHSSEIPKVTSGDAFYKRLEMIPFKKKFTRDEVKAIVGGDHSEDCKSFTMISVAIFKGRSYEIRDIKPSERESN